MNLNFETEQHFIFQNRSNIKEDTAFLSFAELGRAKS